MSKQPGSQREPAADDEATTPLPAAHSETEPTATPRRRRRRVDPEGATLHTGSTAADPTSKKPAMDEIVHPTSPAAPTALTPQPVQSPSHGSTAAAGSLPTEPLEDSFVDAAAARARARDRAVVGSPVAAKILQVVLAILAPIVALIAVIRVVASPVFLWFEYHRPGFPEDLYGMDTEQRLTLGSYGLDYLFNLAQPAYLGQLQFPNGNPVFTEAEVGHMVDVKQVMFATLLGGLIAAIICLVAIVLLYRMRKGAIARSLFAGAVWFTAAMILLAVVAALGWEAFFAGFHQLFFADGTWTFYTTDTLIRLYPGQFWIDAAVWVAALTLGLMVITMIVTAPTGRRRYRAAQAQRFMESQVTGDPEH